MPPHQGNTEGVQRRTHPRQNLVERLFVLALGASGHRHQGERVPRPRALGEQIAHRIHRRHPAHQPRVVRKGAKGIQGGQHQVASGHLEGRGVVGLGQPQAHAGVGDGRIQARQGGVQGRGADLGRAASAFHLVAPFGALGPFPQRHGGRESRRRAAFGVQDLKAAHEAPIDPILEPPHRAALNGHPPFAADGLAVTQVEQGEKIALGAVATQPSALEPRAQVPVEVGPRAHRVDPGPGNPGLIGAIRAVARGKEIIVALHLQGRAHPNIAALVAGQSTRGQETMGRGPGRPERQVAGQRMRTGTRVLQPELAEPRFLDPRSAMNLDAPARHFAFDSRCHGAVATGQDFFGRSHDAHFRRAAQGAQAGLNAEGQLHPRHSGTHHNHA